MSLINEALERARDEEARRQSTDKGMPLPRRYQHGSPATRRAPLTMILMAALLAISLGFIAFLLTRDSTARPTQSLAQNDPASAQSPITPPKTDETISADEEPEGPLEPGSPSLEDPSALPQSEPVKQSAIDEVSMEAEVPAKSDAFEPVPPVEQEPVPQGAAARPSEPQEVGTTAPAAMETPVESLPSRPDEEVSDRQPQDTEPPMDESMVVEPREVDPRAALAGAFDSGSEPQQEIQLGDDVGLPPPASYLRVAELADGVRLELDGIAWSEAGSFALINGRVIGTREEVEGYTVVWIEQEQVELIGREGRVLLRLK